jgi:hypothetical protein
MTEIFRGHSQCLHENAGTVPSALHFLHNIYSARTSRETHYTSAANTYRLTLFRETENHTKHKNTLYGAEYGDFYVTAGGIYT